VKSILHIATSFISLLFSASRHMSHISLICDKSVTIQNLAFLIYWYIKKRLQMHI